MIRIALTMLAATLLATPAMADHSAIGYWFLDVAALTNEVNRVGSLAKADQSTLDKKAECHGYFTGNSNMWLQARTVQVRLKAEEQEGDLTYSMSLSWPHVKRSPVETSGQIKISDAFVAKDGWQQEKYVLVIRRLNLLK